MVLRSCEEKVISLRAHLTRRGAYLLDQEVAVREDSAHYGVFLKLDLR